MNEISIRLERENPVTGDVTAIDLIVGYIFISGCLGQRDSLCGMRGCGAPIEPDEPDECEIQYITDASGQEFDPTSKEMDDILQACWNDHAS